MRRKVLVAIALSAALTVTLRADSNLKRAIDAARREIPTWTLVPKINLGMAAVYHVYPDGTPTDDEQGKLYWKKGTHFSENKKYKEILCLEAGSTYRLTKGMSRYTFLDFEVNGDVVRIQLFDCMRFKIYYDGRVTAEDLKPDALAQALSGFFEIRGPNLSRGGSIQTRLQQALDPVEVSGRSASFRGLAFRHPSGWRAEPVGRNLYYRRSGSKAEIKVQSFELKRVQAAAGAEILFTESFPDRLLSALRKKERRARLLEVGTPRASGPFVYGWADGQAKKEYVAWHWVHDTRGAKAWEFVATGKMSDASDLRQAMQNIASTLAPAAAPAEPLAAEGPSHFSETPTVGKVEVEAVPVRVRHGEQVDLVLRFEVHGPTEGAVDVSQSWTLSLDGSALPNYPNERQVARERGSHEAAVEQVIPAGADFGVYKLKGEVCVGDACSSRTTTFEVVP